VGARAECLFTSDRARVTAFAPDVLVMASHAELEHFRTHVPRAHAVNVRHGMIGKSLIRRMPERASARVFDFVCVGHQESLAGYEHGGARPQGYWHTGYPQVDPLFRRDPPPALPLDPDRPTVLYAPTWSPYSSLNIAGESIIESLARLGGNVIVKLHDRSYDRADRASGGIDWRGRLDGLSRRFGICVAEGFDAAPYLFAADALVTDHSSVGFEFMLLDRPLVVVDCPELLVRARVSPHKVALLRSGADVVEASGVGEGVRRALAEPRRHSARRRAIGDELFYGAGGAAARAAASIYDAIQLPHPLHIPAPAAVEVAAGFPSFETRTT
jgi:hypothetical protein